MGGTPMIPGGVTEQVKLAGGERLEKRLDALLGGERTDVAIYALTSALVRLMIFASEDEAEALAFVDVIAADIKNGVRLNDTQIREQVALLTARLAPLSERRQ